MTRTRTIAVVGLVALCATGCFVRKNAEDVSGMGAGVMFDDTDGTPSGAMVQGIAGTGGMQIEAELVGHRVHRAEDTDGTTRPALGLGLGVRASLLGIVADDHRLERYFDFGATAGVVGSVVKTPPNFVDARGEAYYGGWTEIGLSSTRDGYLALTGELRVSDATETWDDIPVSVTVGLAWRKRGPPTRTRWRD
jgi:hypothetical protein